jgi:hypothetical protein
MQWGPVQVQHSPSFNLTFSQDDGRRVRETIFMRFLQHFQKLGCMISSGRASVALEMIWKDVVVA